MQKRTWNYFLLRDCRLHFDDDWFRFTGFNDLNKEDQTELKKKFGSATVSRKRKNDKTASSTNDNGDAPKAKQSKIEEKTQSTSEKDETLQKKVSYLIFLIEIFSSILLVGTKWIIMEIQRCFEKGSTQWCSQRITWT